jgi:hypothetical protein
MSQTEGKRIFQVKLPEDLWEEFFRAFPGLGERSLLIERFIEHAVRLKSKRDVFILGVLQEAREKYTSLREEE